MTSEDAKLLVPGDRLTAIIDGARIYGTVTRAASTGVKIVLDSGGTLARRHADLGEFDVHESALPMSEIEMLASQPES